MLRSGGSRHGYQASYCLFPRRSAVLGGRWRRRPCRRLLRRLPFRRRSRSLHRPLLRLGQDRLARRRPGARWRDRRRAGAESAVHDGGNSSIACPLGQRVRSERRRFHGANCYVSGAAVADARCSRRRRGHWSAEGGTPVVVAQGETAALLATRYGVPTDALLRANGFNVASQVQPGSRLVIPVYRAGGAPVVATRVPAGPAKAAAAVPAETKPVAAKPAAAGEARGRRQAGGAGEAGAQDRSGTGEGQAGSRRRRPSPRPRRRRRSSKRRPRIAAATPARAVKTERIARGPSSPEASEAEPKIADARSKPVVAETPAETPSARKVDTTATASIPPATDAKAVASDEGRPEFRWPARGRIIQGFTSGGNDGINIAVPEGTQVKAAEGGVVAYAGSELKGYGNLVLIRHPNGFVSAYAHNGELDVKRGDQVKRGQTIAKSGQSGNVGSPQLHFELRKGSTPVDPTRYLAGL